MNKTFTAAIAIAATAGLAMAAVETPAAGYEEKDAGTSQILVCNPFLSFDTSASPTLGDIDGSNIANGDYIAKIDASGHVTRYYWHEGSWYTEAAGAGTKSDSVALARGDAIQFSGTASNPLLLSGIIDDAELAAKAANTGYTVVGNAAPVSKTLGDFSVGGNYNYNTDYVNLNGTKYIYKNGNWLVKDTGANANTVSVAAGDGLFLYCQKRSRGSLTATITVPSL